MGYITLRGFISDRYKTQTEFAKQLGMAKTTLHYKIKGESSFSQDEIAKCIELLDLTPKDVYSIFFNIKVQKTEQ